MPDVVELKGAPGVCGRCGWHGTGVRVRHAQGAWLCGACDDGRRDPRDMTKAAWDHGHAVGLYVDGRNIYARPPVPLDEL